MNFNSTSKFLYFGSGQIAPLCAKLQAFVTMIHKFFETLIHFDTTGIQRQSQTSYNVPCNGIVSDGAQIGCFEFC